MGVLHTGAMRNVLFQKPLEPYFSMVHFEAIKIASTYDPFPTLYHDRPHVYKSFN